MSAPFECPIDLPETDIDPFSRENILTPNGYQEALRPLGDIVWLRKYGVLCVARHDSVTRVLQDPMHFISSGGVGLSDVRKPGAWRPTSPIAEVDPPGHTSVRKAMNRIVSPVTVRNWRAGFSELAEEICSGIAKGRSFDAVRDVIEPYVLRAFSGALGIEAHGENLIIVGNHSFNASGPQNEFFYETEAKLAEIADWYERTQQSETMIPGGFGERVFEAEAAGELPPETASPMLRTLIRGGMDTTISALGTLLRHLAEQPQWLPRIQEDRRLVLACLEESIRLESPVQCVFRTTSDGASFAGVDLPDDLKVQVLIGAANRDPDRWLSPDVFNPERDFKSGMHTGFGHGVHNCLGQMIARAEVQCFMNVFLDHFKDLRLASPVSYRAMNVLRTLDELPITVH